LTKKIIQKDWYTFTGLTGTLWTGIDSRGNIEKLAVEMKPMLQGIINYFCKFSKGHMRKVCNQLNKRLMKWAQWEQGLYVMASVRWLKKKYKDNPNLFPHWALVHP
jgi:RNA-directed DNA polymerase